jgi:hypothetical protein
MTITERRRVVRVVIDPAGRAGCPWRLAGLQPWFSDDPVHRLGSRCQHARHVERMGRDHLHPYGRSSAEVVVGGHLRRNGQA